MTKTDPFSIKTIVDGTRLKIVYFPGAGQIALSKAKKVFPVGNGAPIVAGSALPIPKSCLNTGGPNPSWLMHNHFGLHK
jgi:hypothetical protein